MLVGIDPGHGGKDRGASSSLMVEADYVWGFSSRLATALQLIGHRTVLSREFNEDPSFKIRAQTLAPADVVFSIHVNAGLPSWSRSIYFWNSDNESKAADSLRLVESLYDYWPVSLKRAKKSTAIWKVNAEAAKAQSWLGRPLNVLKQHKQPMALLELFFLSNPADVRLAEHPFIEESMRWAVIRALDNLSR